MEKGISELDLGSILETATHQGILKRDEILRLLRSMSSGRRQR